jgi:hypothetical protein
MIIYGFDAKIMNSRANSLRVQESTIHEICGVAQKKKSEWKMQILIEIVFLSFYSSSHVYRDRSNCRDINRF